MAAHKSARSALCLETSRIWGSSDKMAPSRDFLLAENFSIFGNTYHVYFPWTNPESYWMKAHEFDAETFWSSQEGFLLKNAMVLENLEISTQKTLSHSYRVDVGLAAMDRPKNITTEQRLEFSQKLLAFPRASTCAAIHFS
ncbi:hypothetical protein COLO4_33628 [Corchorus olitorius]|uniref:Uncharacterized protein n=1 Tax=Corchorus olitorius TaxID=93759 RepID=A0A1R3GSA0_9ROSI|nr:hypothetical protein COLO4_33628 [Corchorus olitorius]